LKLETESISVACIISYANIFINFFRAILTNKLYKLSFKRRFYG